MKYKQKTTSMLLVKQLYQSIHVALYTNTICMSLSCMWESAPPLLLYRQAEELAEDIVGMRNYLGDKFMPLHKYPDFPRGVVECGSQTLISAQYFEEIPFYGPPRPCGHEPMQITKFYEWQAVKVSRVSFLLTIVYIPSNPCFSQKICIGQTTACKEFGGIYWSLHGNIRCL